MLKKAFLFLLVFCSFKAMSFQSDTSGYKTQRLRVNALLAERSAKFGQYDQSLNERTGIFGFQTKKDIRNSNEILRQIVLNDNNIFKELKTLMDYKDLEVKEVKTNADQTNGRIQNYMLSIKNLQDQHQLLTNETNSLKKGKNLANTIAVVLVLCIIGLLYFFTTKLKRLKELHKTNGHETKPI